MHAVTDQQHPHTAILLKPTAVIFGTGVFLFGLAYLFLMYAYVYAEHYVGILDQAAQGETPTQDSRGPRDASVTSMKRSVVADLASTFCFFVGFSITMVALVRY